MVHGLLAAFRQDVGRDLSQSNLAETTKPDGKVVAHYRLTV